jgi:hypothetical protein
MDKENKIVDDEIDGVSDIDNDNDNIFNNEDFIKLAKNVGNKIMPRINSMKDNFSMDEDKFFESVKSTQNICDNNIITYLEFIKTFDKSKIDLTKYIDEKEFRKIFGQIYLTYEHCDELEKNGFDKQRLENHKKAFTLTMGMPLYSSLMITHFFKEQNLEFDKEIFELFTKNLMDKMSPLMKMFGQK